MIQVVTCQPHQPMRLAEPVTPGHDVVLLDAGCRLGAGALERLAACAARVSLVATVVPFTSQGPFGYTGQDAAPALLDALFREENPGASVEVPGAGGRCVLVTAAALEAAGPFDDLDRFCASASDAGLRHLLCADVFVAVAQDEVAPEPSRDGPRAAAWREYGERDPARPLRRRVDLARLRRSPRPRVLLVTHHWGGGVEKHVEDVTRLLQHDCEVLRMRPMDGDAVEIAWLRPGESAAAWIEVAEWPVCVELLASAGISRLHVHHVHGLPREALHLAAELGVPYDVTLHDYYPFCPRYHLWPGEGVECGDTESSRCDRCLATRPAQWGLELEAWRALFRDFLARAERVIVPSHDVARRLRRYLPEIAPLVWPHPEWKQPDRPVVKVALIGSVSEIKGLALLEQCAADASGRALPLHFHVIGHTERALTTWPDAPLTVGGTFPYERLSEAIAIASPDAFLFLSVVPETYSYALSTAIRTGLPIVATRLGAFAERLRDHPRHRLVSIEEGAGAFNDALLALAPQPPAARDESVGAHPDTYRRQLLSPLAGAEPRPITAGPALPARIWYRHPAPGREMSLQEMYDVGVLSGHRETRAVLEANIGPFEAKLRDAIRHSEGLADQVVYTRAELEQSRIELEAARVAYDRHERELQDAVERARARIQELESSTFWRMTWPLRVTLHQAKRTVRAIRRAIRHPRSLVPRLATARQIAKDEGVVELLRRVHGKISARTPARTGLRAREGLAPSIGLLRVPTSDAPRVSVVIPAYGQDLHTFSCLRALAEEAGAVPLEVIVMDDASPRPVAEALSQVSGVRFVRNESNQGFLRNCNLGVSLARGEFVLLLNNDALIEPGAMRALLGVFERFPAAGAAGAKLVYPDGRLQEAGGIVWRDGSAWNDGRGQDPDRPEYNYVREADYCSAACLMVRTALLHQLKGFDERYAPAYYEDTDLCFRIREAGHKVYYQPAAEAVHFEGASHGSDLAQGPKRHQVENQAKFRERWKAVLPAHRNNGMQPRLERDRSARRRVLIVEACMLTPDQDSGSLRTWRLIEEMQAMGCKVTFIAANLERREPYVTQLQQAGVEVLFAPFVHSVDELIRERGADFDIIVMARYYIALHHLDAVRRFAPRALLVFDTIDLHYLRHRRLAELEKSASLAQGAEAIRRQELECIRRSDVTWVVSEVELEILAREVPDARVIVQTNIHDPAREVPGHGQRDGLLFVGGFRHPPNVDAALYLAREIVPRLATRLPGVKTYIVGSNAPRSIASLETSGVEVVGYVPEVAPWLDRCRVSVSPLRYGAGVKGKVNQAMSHGLPVVATSPSIEGMHLTDGEEVLIADDADAFAEAVARLYRDPVLWERLSRAGMASVERHFGREGARRALAQLFEIADRRRAVISASQAAREAA